MTMPDGWTKGTLGDTCDIEIGGTPSRTVEKYWDIDRKTENVWVSIKDLRSRVITETAEQISDLGIKNSNAKLQPVGTVLLSFKLTIGRVAFAGRPLYTNEAIAGLRPKSLNSEYLYYGLQQWNLLQGVDQAVKGATLNKEKLKKIKFIYPESAAEQSKIAEILSTVDRAIEQTEALIAKQQRIKTGLMQDLLTRGIDEHGNLRSEATHKFKDSPLGRIPVEWEVATIGDYCKVKRGASPRPIQDSKWWGGEVGWVRIADVTSSRKYLLTTTQHLSPLGVRYSVLLNAGEVILSICATIGRPIITTFPVCIHDGFVWFDGLSDKIDREWFYYYLQSKEEKLAGSRQVGTQGNLNTGIVSKTYFLVPSYREEQERIACILRTIDDTVDRSFNTLEKLKRLKTALMQDLLTGRRRVTALLEQQEGAGI
ncbi:MAG: restriction endonuclease subunit S [Acidobacteria bacterium]|nr:restriction endonuclease subunit S [Acidobacteriota bacterium]